jgi:hypothetical protein
VNLPESLDLVALCAPLEGEKDTPQMREKISDMRKMLLMEIAKGNITKVHIGRKKWCLVELPSIFQSPGIIGGTKR